VNQGPIVVIGDVMTDVITRMSAPVSYGSDTAAEIVLRPGGSGANTAAWLGHLGVPTVFLGCVGDDALGRDARRALESHGVTAALAVAPDVPTGTCVVLVDPDGERSMLPDAGANAHLAADDLPREAFAAGGHLHVSGYTLIRQSTRAAAVAALDLARESGMTTSVDPSSAAPLAEIGGELFLSLITDVDLVFVTCDEGEILCGSRDPAEIAALLGRDRRDVVVKRGAQGALWFGPSDEATATAQASALTIDTTGAGDAFAAGLLSARRHGVPIVAALADACRVAAGTVAVTGALPPPRAAGSRAG
jgi:ribokinase